MRWGSFLLGLEDYREEPSRPARLFIPRRERAWGVGVQTWPPQKNTSSVIFLPADPAVFGFGEVSGILEPLERLLLFPVSVALEGFRMIGGEGAVEVIADISIAYGGF